jgi:hypothetical protein
MGKDNVEDRQDFGLSQKSNPEERDVCGMPGGPVPWGRGSVLEQGSISGLQDLLINTV